MPRANRSAAESIITAIKWLLLAYFLVMLLLFAVVPRLVRPMVIEALSTPNYTVELESLSLNPFSLQATAHGFRLSGKDGDNLLEFTRLTAGLQASSAFFWAWTLSDFRLDDPRINLVIAKNGQLNWAQWLDELAGDAPPEVEEEEARAGLPRIIVNEVSLSRGRIIFVDRSRGSAFSTAFGPLSIQVSDLNTLPGSGAPYSISASTEHGERIEWLGDIGLQPLRSRGRLTLSGFSLPTVAEYADDWIDFDVVDGSMSLSGEYDFHSEGNQLLVSDGRFSLRDVALQTENGAEPLLGFGGFSLGGIAVDLQQKQVSVRAIRLVAPMVNESIDADGNSFLVGGLLGGQSAPAAQEPVSSEPQARPIAAQSVSPEPAVENGDSEKGEAALPLADWTLHIKAVQLIDGRADIRDHSQLSPVALSIRPVDLLLTDLRYPDLTVNTLHLSAQLDGADRLSVSGNLALLPFKSALQLQVEDLALSRLVPYVQGFANVDIESGSFATELAIEVAETDKGLATIVSGSASLAQVRVRDLVRKEELFHLTQLSLDGLGWESIGNLMALTVASINVDEPYARVIVFPDAETNVSQLMVGGDQPAPEEAGQSQASVRVQVNQIGVANGTARFSDRSLPRIPFEASIFDIRGSVNGLDNSVPKPAEITFVGAVGAHSPVSLNGQLRPLAEQFMLDVDLRFNNMDLTQLNPYADTYAGYEIEKGKLNAGFVYQLDKNQLNGDNSVYIDQLTLGERTGSDLATSLPVVLAIALLQDKDGVIDLQLPVTGDVDDPAFDFGGLIGKAVANVITKLVTSPFRFLGGLAGGDGEDMDVIAFEPGKASLGDSELNKLSTLAVALNDRPGLRLSIEGQALAGADGEALQLARLTSQLQDSGISVPVAEDQWSQVYKFYESDSDLTVKKLRKQIAVEGEDAAKLEQRLRKQVWASMLAAHPVSQQDYETLASERASAVMSQLINEGIAVERLFNQAPNLVDATDKPQPICQLSLDAV